MKLQIAVTVMACAVLAFAQDPVDTSETWNSGTTAGWTNNSSQVAVSNPSDYLNMAHLKQGMPAVESDIVRVAIDPGIRLTNVSFRFKADNVFPSAVRLYLHAAQSSNLWYSPLAPPDTGEEKSYDVAVDFEDALWGMGPNSTAVEFDQDVQLIDWVGIYVRRHGDTAKQNYAIDDFRMQGIYYSDVDGDRIPNAWEMTYGLDPLNAGDALADDDQDGMNGFAEYWAGTHPLNAASVFEVEIGVTNHLSGDKGVILLWDSIPDRTYAVWSTPSLDSGFVTLVSGLPATPYTNVYEDVTATNGLPKYYMVEVEVPGE
ncbi:MAG: hypothetical protein QGI24_07640 [Kiritimatiellia bacterium]|nr:hypothetical protein [Kiritimatiellia bacterium]MDP6848644.1 hypothetical protein [Kiritimatiellia bacterium]